MSVIYKSIVRPLLFCKEPEASHEMILGLLSRLEFLCGTLGNFYRVEDDRLKVQIGPLTFPNPVGLAAGVRRSYDYRPAQSVHSRLGL